MGGSGAQSNGFCLGHFEVVGEDQLSSQQESRDSLQGQAGPCACPVVRCVEQEPLKRTPRGLIIDQKTAFPGFDLVGFF